jgi:hypothetical protein
MEGSASKPVEEGQKVIQGWSMPTWEKATWILIVIYITIILLVFWYLGWKELGFPL